MFALSIPAKSGLCSKYNWGQLRVNPTHKYKKRFFLIVSFEKTRLRNTTYSDGPMIGIFEKRKPTPITGWFGKETPIILK